MDQIFLQETLFEHKWAISASIWTKSLVSQDLFEDVLFTLCRFLVYLESFSPIWLQTLTFLTQHLFQELGTLAAPNSRLVFEEKNGTGQRFST